MQDYLGKIYKDNFFLKYFFVYLSLNIKDMYKAFLIKYEVHCILQNFFGKEMIVKNCLSELHAKSKLEDFCKKKYGSEYHYIVIKSCSEHFLSSNGKIDSNSMKDIFSNFGDIFGGKK